MGSSMMFMGAAGQKAAGDYAITDTGGKQQLALTDDFAVAPRADLYLVLANGDTPAKGALWLGKLKSASGAQAYDLPKGKDLSKFTKLLVWSKKEKQAAASRRLASGGGRQDGPHVTGGRKGGRDPPATAPNPPFRAVAVEVVDRATGNAGDARGTGGRPSARDRRGPAPGAADDQRSWRP